jgi:RimJ/RimL family protein N-acetyltransferase
MTTVEALTGPRVTLRAPTLDDAGPLFERACSDPEVARYMVWQVHPDVEETRRVIREVLNSGGETSWAIDLPGTGPIGVIGSRRPRPHHIEFGYYLGRPWWRQGYMTEAVRLLLDSARRDPAVYRVSAYCHVDNTASARLLENCGLRLEGRLARCLVLPNLGPEPQDCLLYGLALR